MLLSSEVKGAVSAFGKPSFFPLELHEELIEREVASGEYAQIAMHRQYIFFGIHGQCHAYGYGFLSETAKPF